MAGGLTGGLTGGLAGMAGGLTGAGGKTGCFLGLPTLRFLDLTAGAVG